MKKLVLSIYVAVLSFVSAQAYDFESGGLYYNLLPDGVSVEVTNNCEQPGDADGSCYSGNIVIPDVVNHEGADYAVTSIGEYAFGYCVNVISVDLPASLQAIGMEAFAQCEQLETIDFINSPQLNSLGEDAFWYCASLKEIELPSSLNVIGAGAFRACIALEKIKFPETLTTIEYSAFTCCESLVNVELPGSIQTIGADVFSQCKLLESVNFPASLQSIGAYAFSECVRLPEINLSECVLMHDIGDYAFSFCDALAKVDFPPALQSISESAFSSCVSLTSIKFPATLQSLGRYAFGECESMTDFDFSECKSLHTIGDAAFTNCYALENIDLSVCPSLQTFGEELFQGCTSLKTFSLPSGIQSLSGWMFSLCSALTDVDLSSYTSLLEIGEYAFGDCMSLTNIVLPEGLQTIRDAAFISCPALHEVDFPASLKSIGGYIFTPDYKAICSIAATEPPATTEDAIYIDVLFVPAGCADIYKETGAWAYGIRIVEESASEITLTEGETLEEKIGENTNITDLTIHGKLSSEDIAFINTRMTNVIYLDISDTDCIELPQYAFSTGSLYKVKLPKKLEIINVTALGWCTYLCEIDMPATVTEIYYGAFANHEVLNYSGDLESLCNINFENETLWSSECPTKVYIDGELITDLVIPNTVNAIKSYTFGFNHDLKTVLVPNSVTSVGSYAFEYCDGLNSVVLPETLTFIDNSAFYGCENLEALTIYAETAPEIGDMVFGYIYDCLLSIPSQSEESYRGNEKWQTFINDYAGVVQVMVAEDNSAARSFGNNYTLKYRKQNSENAFAATTCDGMSVYGSDGQAIEFLIEPAENFEVKSVKYADVDVTADCVNNVYTTPGVVAGEPKALEITVGRIGTSAVEDIAENDINVRCEDVLILIEGAEGVVEVYNLSGYLVMKTDAQAVELPAGVYIVKVGDKAFKAVVR